MTTVRDRARPLPTLRRPAVALATAGLSALLHASALFAGWTDFLPRTLDNGAYLEVQGLLEEEDNR